MGLKKVKMTILPFGGMKMTMILLLPFWIKAICVLFFLCKKNKKRGKTEGEKNNKQDGVSVVCRVVVGLKRKYYYGWV